MKQLNEELNDALRDIIGGADVSNYFLARKLREVQKIAPEYVWIGRTMGDYSATEQLPYFGAIVTKTGLEYLKKINKQ